MYLNPIKVSSDFSTVLPVAVTNAIILVTPRLFVLYEKSCVLVGNDVKYDCNYTCISLSKHVQNLKASPRLKKL